MAAVRLDEQRVKQAAQVLLDRRRRELPSVSVAVVRAETSSKSCDQAIFVDHGTSASLFSDAVLVEIDQLGQWFQRLGYAQGAVRRSC
jgi:hypothetical protein